MTLVLFAGPTLEPLTVQEATDFSRITEDSEDDNVEGLIRSARAHVEQLTGRALITQTWDLYLDEFPYCYTAEGWRYIDIPKPPLQSVTFVKYYDSAGVQQTLATSEYTVDSQREPGRVYQAYGKSWPSTYPIPNAVQVRFIAGYGPAASDIDARAPELRQAISTLVGTMYEQRETNTDQPLADVPEAFYQLVNQHRMFWI